MEIDGYRIDMKRRKSRMTQREVAQFNTQIQAFLLSIGAMEDVDPNPFPARFTLKTIVGTLKISLCDWKYLTVFGRFDDIEAASEICDINQFSGKWNHHYGTGPIADSVADFKRQIVRIMPMAPMEQSND